MKMIRNGFFLSAVSFLLASVIVAIASQSNTWSPTTGTVSGLQLTSNYNAAFSALQSCNSGATAPANDVSLAAVKGQCWLDTSVTPNILKQFDGTSWIILGYMDTTNHRWLPPIGGGTDTIASATTTDLGSKAAGYISITSTTTITGFGSSAVTGTMKVITFAGALTLTYSSPGLILPTAASVTTVAGDTALAVATGSGNWTVVAYNRADGTALSSSNNVASTNLAASALGFDTPVNLRLNATVGASALTIALKGVNNSDPSPSNPVKVVFRDSTLANGDPVVVSIEAATSLVIASTATLGATNGVPFRGWLVMYNNGGTGVMGVMNASDATHIYPLAESGVASPTNGAGNSAGVQYSASGVSANSAFRIIGYFEYSAGLATAGTYNIAPTTVQIFGPGIRKPGDVVQAAYANTNTVGSTSSASFVALTSGLTQAISPTSTINLIRVTASGSMSQSTAGNSFIQLQRAGAVIGYPFKQANITSGPFFTPLTMALVDAPSTTSSTTYGFQGKTDVGTVAFPASGTGVYLLLEEIMGAAPTVYDNDNDPRLLNSVG